MKTKWFKRPCLERTLMDANSPPHREAVGRFFRACRGRQTLEEVAKKAKVTKQYIHKCETGKVTNPTIFTLRRLADGYECGVQGLVKGLEMCLFDWVSRPTVNGEYQINFFTKEEEIQRIVEGHVRTVHQYRY